jgi:CheY-like chemotaxis protein
MVCEPQIQNPEFKIQNPTMTGSILIADDYADNRELLRLMLTAAGYRVREARDGRECILMLEEELPDIVLVDLSMPVLDGWGVLKELRATERTRHIPCVAVTAFSDYERMRSTETDFDAYLTKPFRTQELLNTVARLMAKDPQGV